MDVALPMHNLIEYRDYYLKTSGGLWHYYRDEPVDWWLILALWLIFLLLITVLHLNLNKQ